MNDNHPAGLPIRTPVPRSWLDWRYLVDFTSERCPGLVYMVTKANPIWGHDVELWGNYQDRA